MPRRQTRCIPIQTPFLTLQNSGIARELRTRFPCKAVEDVKAGIVDSSSFLNPLQMGFTTNSTLYSIEYEITIRAYLSGAKDLRSSQPIHVCSWDAKASTQIMKSIEKAAATEHRRDSNSHPSPGRDRYGNGILVY